MFTWKVSIKLIVWLVGLLVVVGLACNAPIGDETPSPPPPATPAETNPPTQIIPDSATAESPTTETNPTTQPETTTTALPTFTPIQPTTPANATATETAEPTETVRATIRTTPTESANSGPLSFTYSIVWEVSSNPAFAIATVTINATGGGGGYQYFRDDLPVDGPVFQYQWATCRANPGSLRVDSADGQSVRTNYFETPPCPDNS